MKAPTPLVSPSALPWRSGLAYGAMGFPLAFAALPLYVLLPHHYAQEVGLSLTTIGVLLMAVRLIDAVLEPWLGRASDALLRRGAVCVMSWVASLALLQWLGMGALFGPAVQGTRAQATWLVVGLLWTCTAHSLLVIVHQAWGVRLGGDDVQRSRIVAWREGLGLAGVVVASAVSVVGGAPAMLLVLGVALVLGLGGWQQAPRPLASRGADRSVAVALWQPLRYSGFRRLLAVFICNGIASAIPAALMLFFAQDRLHASEQVTAGFLALYFVCGAASMPLWLCAVRRWGVAPSWMLGMLLAVVCFAWTAVLHSGQIASFALICACTGLCLGADLALPGALLAGWMAAHGVQGQHDGAYLGWWSLANKLNLALAAGAALPLLQWLGYTPGTQDAQALQHLAWAYALVPCALKLMAAILCYALLLRSGGIAHTVFHSKGTP